MITWGSCRLYLHSRPSYSAAFPARHGRSRVLPRHHPVPEPVVSREAARGGRRVVHGGRADLDRDRFAVVGRDHADAADVQLADWQMLYIVEALPAVVLGFVVLRCLTDAPSKAAWLRGRARLAGRAKAEADARHTHAGHTAARGSCDPRVLALALIYFGTSAGLYTLGLGAADGQAVRLHRAADGPAHRDSEHRRRRRDDRGGIRIVPASARGTS